ncbi:insulin-like growth factor-like 1 [Microplitis demolitor]|nr:insulin-like growth factor-like 1 [Microplitis demolitor]
MYSMRINLTLLIIIISIMFNLVVTSPLNRSSGKIRVCSSALSNTLKLVCSDGYNEPSSNESRSNSPTGGGIVEECCHKACSLETLRQYCQ